MMTSEQEQAPHKIRPRPIPTTAEAEQAIAIRNRLRAIGFDLMLWRDGSVLIKDAMHRKWRTPPADLLENLWANVKAVGAMLEDEKREQ